MKRRVAHEAITRLVALLGVAVVLGIVLGTAWLLRTGPEAPAPVGVSTGPP